MDGRYDDGAQLADEALAYGQAAHIETALQMYGVAQIDIARARGGVEALEPLVAAMVEQYPLLPAWRTGLIYLYTMLDRPDDVREQVEILAADDFADVPTDANLGNRDRASHLGVRRRRRPEESGASVRDAVAVRRLLRDRRAAGDLGRIGRALARAARPRTTDRWDVADEHFARAMERNAESGARAWTVHGKYEYAALLVRRRHEIDAPRLGDLLRECLAGATEMGMTRVVDQTRALADTAGVNLH